MASQPRSSVRLSNVEPSSISGSLQRSLAASKRCFAGASAQSSGVGPWPVIRRGDAYVFRWARTAEATRSGWSWGARWPSPGSTTTSEEGMASGDLVEEWTADAVGALGAAE